MPKGGTMKAAAEAAGSTLDALIPKLMDETGSAEKTAMSLNVSRNSVKNWLHNNDRFFIDGRWQHIEGSTERWRAGLPIK